MPDEEADAKSGDAEREEPPRVDRIREWTAALVIMMLLTLLLIAFLFFVRGVTV